MTVSPDLPAMEDTTAYDLLFQRRRQALYALALQRLRSPDDAEDAVQETYLKGLAVAWDAVQSPDAMLTTILLNGIRDLLRRRRSSPVEAEAYERAAETVAAAHPDPEQSLIGKLAWEAVVTAINALPPVSRKVFVLGKIEQLSSAEISARTGMSRAAIEKNLVRAMQRLRRVLG